MKRIAGLMFGVLLGLTMLAPQAFAGLSFYPGNIDEILYNNYENLFAGSGHPGVAPGTLLPGTTVPVAGDHLAGIFQVNRVINLTGGGASNIPDVITFTGVFDQKITSISGGPAIFALTLGNPSIFTFTDGGADTFTLSDLSASKMFAVYVDPVAGGTPFTFQGTMASNVADATDSALLLTAGIDTAHDPSNVSFATVFAPFPPFGVATTSLSIKDNNTGLSFSPHLPVTFVGPSGELVLQSRFVPNSDPKSKWQFTSFDPAELEPNIIPEVSSLWMLGMGLSGVGLIRRKKLIV